MLLHVSPSATVYREHGGDRQTSEPVLNVVQFWSILLSARKVPSGIEFSAAIDLHVSVSATV